jgi:hypothetical protein
MLVSCSPAENYKRLHRKLALPNVCAEISLLGVRNDLEKLTNTLNWKVIQIEGYPS